MCELTIIEKNSQLSRSRYNGCSPPLHPFQFIAWFFVCYFCVIFFGVLAPSSPSRWHATFYVTAACLVTVHIVTQITASVINPVDNNVLKKYKRHGRRVFIPQFNRSQHSHVIENQFCHLCDVHVHIKSKHCSACNKCIENFDHHCKWLNNCIGTKNYWTFFLCILTAVVILMLVFGSSVSHLVVYYEYPRVLQSDRGNNSLINDTNANTTSPEPEPEKKMWLKVFGHLVPDEVWLSLVGSCGVLALLAAALVGQLLLLHVYLICRGLTTYDYIMMSRSAAVENVESGEVATPKHRSSNGDCKVEGPPGDEAGSCEVSKADNSEHEQMNSQSSTQQGIRPAERTSPAPPQAARRARSRRKPPKSTEIETVSAVVHRSPSISSSQQIQTPSVKDQIPDNVAGTPRTPDNSASKKAKRARRRRKKRARIATSSDDVERSKVVDSPNVEASRESLKQGHETLLTPSTRATSSPLSVLRKTSPLSRLKHQSPKFKQQKHSRNVDDDIVLREIPVSETASGALFEKLNSTYSSRHNSHQAMLSRSHSNAIIPTDYFQNMTYFMPMTPVALVPFGSGGGPGSSWPPPTILGPPPNLFRPDPDSFARGYVAGQQQVRYFEQRKNNTVTSDDQYLFAP